MMKGIDRAGSIFLRAVVKRMKELGLNNSTLAKRMKVSRPYVVKVLRGDVNITLCSAARFARALETDFFPTLAPHPGSSANDARGERIPSQTSAAAYSYSVVSGDRLTDADRQELSRVFSSFYGTWSEHAPAPMRPGGRIRMSAQRYRDWYARPEFKVARCFADGRLVGQAIYLDVVTSRGLVSFVVQLVVDEAHRHRGIAKSILHAAFGFSDYYAWAIVTSSPCTIAALEAATFRYGNRKRISKDVDFLRSEVFPRIDFLSSVDPEVSERCCRVNSGFFTDRSKPQPDWTSVAERYGELPEGYEWLSVIFRDQKCDDVDSLEQLMECSGRLVREAYVRMPQSRQKWAQKADEETGRILGLVGGLPTSANICDFGAGTGRHIRSFRKAGYGNVSGVDFALSQDGRAAGVVEGDCRTFDSPRRCDLILCLYDVIGSFPDEEDNRRIVENISRNLKDGGTAVLTVANSAFAGKRKVREVDHADRAAFLREAFGLAPSNAMSSDGEIFSHDTLWDRSTGLFYHKEQFKDGACALPAEYMIVDRRYTRAEIVQCVESAGLTVMKVAYVRSGFTKSYNAQTGKEILLVCTKCRSESASTSSLPR